MDGSATGSQLSQIASGPPPGTISDVLTRMQRIANLLLNGDGLKWFNLLYMKVTQQVDSNPPLGGWGDLAWLVRLDVVFARFYLSAISNWLNSPTTAITAQDQLTGAIGRSLLLAG